MTSMNARLAGTLIAACAAAAFTAQRPSASSEARQSSEHKASSADTTTTSNTNDEMQPAQLPAMPPGMTAEMITAGDALFHGRGGCFACHGADAEGLPAAGDAITVGLSFVPTEWNAIDDLIMRGIPDALTRSPIRMPANGARGDLSKDERRALASYVWAISQTRGEPWAGGHATHADMLPPGATRGTAGPPRNLSHNGALQ